MFTSLTAILIIIAFFSTLMLLRSLVMRFDLVTDDDLISGAEPVSFNLDKLRELEAE